jgi:hypothetical protein
MTMTNTERQSQTRTQWLAVKLQNGVAFLPRMVRIVVAAGFAMALLVTLFPLIDELYVRYFFDPATVMVPSLVGVAIAGAMYIWGWYLLVGTVDDEKIKQSASPMLILYFIVGLAAVLADIVLILHGLSLTDTFAG